MSSEPLTELEKASDREVVDRACQGDEPAFEEIVRRYGKRVFQIAARFFRRRSDIEDAAQEVFLRAFSRLPTFQARGSLEGWIARITTNTCLNALRETRRRPEVPVADLTEEETGWLEAKLAGASEERGIPAEQRLFATDLAEKILGRVTPEDRLVLILLDGEGFSVKEVAELTGWSRSKVKVQAFRARRRMRRAIEDLLVRDEKKTTVTPGFKDDP